jgi:hypothetical protein
VGLSFRVRNGTGRFPHAMTAVTLVPVRRGCGARGGKFCGYNCSLCCWERWCCLFSCVPQRNRPVAGLLVGNHIVDASSLVIFLPSPLVQTLLNPFAGWVCGVSYRPISTGQLHESLVLASTSGLSTQWSGWGPLTHKVYGNLILKRASRLDAFSGYPIRT